MLLVQREFIIKKTSWKIFTDWKINEHFQVEYDLL